MQISNFDPSQVFSHKKLPHGCEIKKRKFEVVKQNLPHNKISFCAATSDPEFVISCKESFMACKKIVNTG